MDFDKLHEILMDSIQLFKPNSSNFFCMNYEEICSINHKL